MTAPSYTKPASIPFEDLANQTLSELGRIHVPRGLAPEIASIQRWNQIRERLREPAISKVTEVDAEWAIARAAIDFISAERARLGITANIPELRPYLSHLWSESGFAGLAALEERTYLRYPAFDVNTEQPVLNLALHVHEAVHASGLLSAVRGGEAGEAFTFARSGWMVLKKDGTAFHRAFEEYTASVLEARVLSLNGFQEGVRKRESNECLADPVPLISKHYALELNSLVKGMDCQISQAVRHATEGECILLSNNPEIPEHQNSYAQLVALFDLLAPELYPELPKEEQVSALREDCVRVQAGAPFRLVMARVRANLGTPATQFLSRLGRRTRGLENGSEEMELLRLFVRACDCDEETKLQTRSRIADLHQQLIQSGKRGLSISERRTEVCRAVDSAIESLESFEAIEALTTLTDAGITHEILTNALRTRLLASIEKYPAARRAPVLAHLAHRGIVTQKQLRAHENEELRTARRALTKLLKGVFTPAAKEIAGCSRTTLARLPLAKWTQGFLTALPHLKTSESLLAWCKCVYHIGLENSPAISTALR